jgi:putative protease
MPISQINNIRRELIEKIDKEIMETYIPSRKDCLACKEKIKQFKIDHYKKDNIHLEEKWNIYINSLKQAEQIKNQNYITTVYYDSSFNHKTMKDYIENITDELMTLHEIIPDKEIVWILPQILLDEELPHISEIIVKLKFNDINIKIQTDNIGIAKNLDVEKYGTNLNIYNNYTINHLSKDPGFKKLQVSNEISYEDIILLNNNHCNLEYTVFGYLQLMITKDNFEDIIDEEITNTYYLIDKRNNRYPIKKDCNGNSHIYDYRILNSDKHIEKLRLTNINNFTIDCRFFNIKDTEKIVEYFSKTKNNEKGELTLTSNHMFFEGNIEKGVYKNN